jgi:multisubunit Na+/H+ antiporter MnhE subunit
MNFLKKWLVNFIIIFLLAFVLSNIFFNLTWMTSRDEIPEASFWAGVVFGFVATLIYKD